MIIYTCVYAQEINLILNGNKEMNVVLNGKINEYLCPRLDPLRVNFFKGNRYIYLHFMSSLHTDMTQADEILPQVRQGPSYST